MDFLYLKSLHIIFVVTWFAGLFYIVRLFIYHTEAEDLPEESRVILQNQYKIMSKRLWNIICWPSAIITLILAVLLLYTNPYYLQLPWMHIKLGFVLLLYLYHFACHKIFKQLQNNVISYTSNKLRIWNEIATIILFAIVFLVVLKSTTGWIWGVLGLVGLFVGLMLAIKLYKSMRKV
ncbi:MAG: putative membrane protein [Patiriisocius sp.]|jgi:putative membrane protein